MKTKRLVEICRGLMTIPFYPRLEHDLILERIGRFADDEARLAAAVDRAGDTMQRWDMPEFRYIWEQTAATPRSRPPRQDCAYCCGTGWHIVYRGIYSGASECSCKKN